MNQGRVADAATVVRIGGTAYDRHEAWDAASRYLSGNGGFGYPAYDAFDTGAGPARLSDGDLLAPTLLNVTVRLPAYYALQGARTRLEEWLAAVSVDARLLDAGPADLALLGELFQILDEGLPGVGGTTLAKVMHRKRPDFVPLYDRYIWHCYVGGAGAPIEPATRRTWHDFIPLLAEAMIADLHREETWLSELAAAAKGPATPTTLRALDIVAWRAGQLRAGEGLSGDPGPEVGE